MGLSERDEYFSNYSYNTDGHVFNKHGRRVGTYDKRYGRLSSKFGEVQLSRLLIFLHTGNWPDGEVDHINGDTHDDRICNLRVCSRKENAKNRRAYSSNKVGFKGVYPQKYKGEIINYLASIQVDGERLFLGVFKSPEEAARAYNTAATKFHREFASLNKIKEG